MTINVPPPGANYTEHFAAEEKRIREEERDRILAMIFFYDSWYTDRIEEELERNDVEEQQGKIKRYREWSARSVTGQP